MAHETTARPIWQRILAGLFLIYFLFIPCIAIWQPQESWWKSFIAISSFHCVVFVFAMIAWQFVERCRTGGTVLLDCGPHRLRTLLWIMAVTFAGMTIGVIREMLMNDKFWSWMSPGLSTPVMAAAMAMLATSRLQIKEQGLWIYQGLLPWSSIRSWSFRGNTLILDPPHLAHMYYHGFYDGFPVSPEVRAEAEELLTKLCPKTLPT